MLNAIVRLFVSKTHNNPYKIILLKALCGAFHFHNQDFVKRISHFIVNRNAQFWKINLFWRDHHIHSPDVRQEDSHHRKRIENKNKKLKLKSILMPKFVLIFVLRSLQITSSMIHDSWLLNKCLCAVPFNAAMSSQPVVFTSINVFFCCSFVAFLSVIFICGPRKKKTTKKPRYGKQKCFRIITMPLLDWKNGTKDLRTMKRKF